MDALILRSSLYWKSSHKWLPTFLKKRSYTKLTDPWSSKPLGGRVPSDATQDL